jgi:hypothetical protein
VDELGVGAHGNDVRVQFLEFLVLLRQSSEFGGSDEGKIGGVKEEDGPFLRGLLGREADLSEIAFCGFKGIDLEVRDALPDLQTTVLLVHDAPPCG